MLQTRINLLTALREIDRESKNVSVEVHIISAEDNASTTAEKYGIENQNGAEPPCSSRGRKVHALAKGSLSRPCFQRKRRPTKHSFRIQRITRRVRNHENFENGRRAQEQEETWRLHHRRSSDGVSRNGHDGHKHGRWNTPWEVITELRKQYDVRK